jgi:hypothetical protein
MGSSRPEIRYALFGRLDSEVRLMQNSGAQLARHFDPTHVRGTGGGALVIEQPHGDKGVDSRTFNE